MEDLQFRHLPIAVGVVFYNAWWSIEEFVIGRHGLWKYMPYYKVGDARVWDLAVAVIITVALWSAAVARKDSRSVDQLRAGVNPSDAAELACLSSSGKHNFARRQLRPSSTPNTT